MCTCCRTVKVLVVGAGSNTRSTHPDTRLVTNARGTSKGRTLVVTNLIANFAVGVNDTSASKRSKGRLLNGWDFVKTRQSASATDVDAVTVVFTAVDISRRDRRAATKTFSTSILAEVVNSSTVTFSSVLAFEEATTVGVIVITITSETASAKVKAFSPVSVGVRTVFDTRTTWIPSKSFARRNV